MAERRYEGGCLCGAVRYAGSGPATNLACCHCASCRRATGAPFVAWTTLPADRFSFATEPGRYKSSPQVIRTFCTSCGTSLTYEHEQRPGEIDVTASTLDDPAELEPECHIWVSDKLSWVRLTDGLPQYAEWRRG
ncbi:MAG: GFA family protein [Myxococcota bacterium]